MTILRIIIESKEEQEKWGKGKRRENKEVKSMKRKMITVFLCTFQNVPGRGNKERTKGKKGEKTGEEEE